ncbi:homoserine O-acetyltransferase [Candidatus Nasuia deltocephalinicola str. NAS-ALF]|uniref:Homoserine O-acetyltransferase n=1 Tax=Candidatus Nasuia deltocephalinicola str. NAS-ALF TaxID=1343077 RepID=S5SQG3_9PROT|nr:homoserine O-acetyltransferase [Candidatus Nasuia deltocephalinicola str. NAS-ALF]
MILIYKKLNIKLFIWKKIFKINKNYIKNFKIVCEIKNINFNKNIIIFNALNSSKHCNGTYKLNLYSTGWWSKIIKIFNNFKIIGFSDIGSTYGSNKINLKNIFKNYLNFLLLNYNNLLKLKKNLLKKIKINKFFFNLGGSLGGIKSFIFKILYSKYIKFNLYIATSLFESVRNKIQKNINKNLIKLNIIYNKYFKNFKDLKILKLIRKINSIEYLSKKDIINKFKKIFIKYKIKEFKKNVFKYLNYKNKKFIKYFKIKSYLNLIKIKMKLKFLNIFNKLKNKNIILIFKYDNKFKIKKSLITIKYLFNFKSIFNIKIINIVSGHDSFLKLNIFYKKFIKNLKYFSEW